MRYGDIAFFIWMQYTVIDGRDTAMLCPYNILCLRQVITAMN
jgi:hypothetical protein